MLTLEIARSWYPVTDPVHGFDHVARVYRLAERLAAAEGADLEIVCAAALLHDPCLHDPCLHDTQPEIPVDPEPANERANHHLASADFAHQVLKTEGWSDERIASVLHCIRAHRFRDPSEQPQTLEARILFDADKLDAIGAIGVARALAYAVRDGHPAYSQPSARFIETGELEPGEPHSSYHEFVFKLGKLKERLYTPSARALAQERHQVMAEFYQHLADEGNMLE